MPITIYHNPKCGTSRNVVALVEAAGHTPTIVEYLDMGWGKAQLALILKLSGLRARDILRVKGTDAESLGLTAENVPEEKIIAAMVVDPILVNRPIVVTSKGATLCRPAEKVLELL